MTFTDRAESLGKRSVPDGFEDPTELRITYQGKAYLAAIRHLTIKALEILVTMCAFSTGRQPVDWRAARAEGTDKNTGKPTCTVNWFFSNGSRNITSYDLVAGK
jgi:hypothetical protein